MQTDYYIGIDWGGTRIKLGAVTPQGDFLQRIAYEPERNASIEATFNGLIRAIDQLIHSCSGALLGIGLGLTGAVDPDRGVVYLPGKISGLENFPVVARLREQYAVKVTAANDGVVALHAERAYGKARNLDWASVLTIGTGIGSGVMLDGKIFSDPYFNFGTQIGHLVVKSGDEPLCLTGARGTAEMNCSATTLALAVRSGLQRGIPSTLTERYFADPHSIDFRTVIEEGVEKNDPLCLDELGRWTRNLGWLLVNAVHAYSSQAVILSGGATLGAKHFLAALQTHVNRHVFRNPPDRRIEVVVSDIQEHAGVLGAAVLCQQYRPAANCSVHPAK